MDDKWGGHKPAAMRLAPAESGAGAGPLPARCWHGGGSDGSAGAGPLHSQFALSPPVRCLDIGKWDSFLDIGNYFLISGNWIPDIRNQFHISNYPKFEFPISGNHFPISGIISRYREFELPISENNFRYREMMNKNPNGFPYKTAAYMQ